MNNVQQDLYIRWCQSPRVELVTRDSEGAVIAGYLVPRELLTRRSRYFRELIIIDDDDGVDDREGNNAGKNAAPRHELSDVTQRAVKQLFIWVHSPQPQVDNDAGFEDVARLGVLAWRLRVPALSNQVTDRIRTRLASDEWQLTAEVVDQIYQAAPSGSPLREVVRAALGKLPKSAMEAAAGGGRGGEWKATILKHAELGWDYIEASAGSQPWTTEGYLSGVCRFHDHEDVLGQKSSGALCDGCPFAGEDCYPVSVQEVRKTKKAGGVSDNIREGEAVVDSVTDSRAVKNVAEKSEDAFVDEEEPQPMSASRHRVGTGIMITDDAYGFGYHYASHKPNGTAVGSPEPIAVETNGFASMPERRRNGTQEPAGAETVEESTEAVTSEDQAEKSPATPTSTPVMHTIGTMTEVLNGNGNGHGNGHGDVGTGERADDEAAGKLSGKLKGRRKKRMGGSFSVGSV